MKKIVGIFLLMCMQFTYAAESLEKLTVILDWFPNPDHAPLIIAKEQGFFKENGLDVELIGPADPNDPVKLVATKKVDLGITYEPQFMEQVDQGLPLIRVGTLIDKPLDCIVTLEDSGIKNISDLKGKRIGSGSGEVSNVMLKSMLHQRGIANNDFEIINVRYNVTQALLSHKVDAVTGMMRNFEVPQLELEGKKVVAFFPEDYGIPNYSVLIFVSHLDNVHDKRFPKFLEALRKAVAFLDKHPKDTWEQFAKRYPESNNNVNQEAWVSTLPYFAEDPAEFDKDEWQHFAEFMFKNQMIKKVQPTSRYAVVLR